MARNVTISSLGKQPPSFPTEGVLDCEALVQKMIAFWKAQIEIVLPDKPDVIILPEMCDRYHGTPHEMLPAYRNALGRRMLDELCPIARDNHCYVVYSSALAEEDGSWRNTAVMIGRDGAIVGQYNKNHPVVSEINDGILSGRDAPLFRCDFGTVAFAICFDLNFDELRLKYKELHPDLIIFPSLYHGGLMEAYWAYSCRAHFVGCTGQDTLPNEFYSPVGQKLAASTNYNQLITHTVNLDCAVAHLDFNDGKLRALKKKYGPDVTIFDPGLLGCVLLTSESASVTIQEMVAEFEIELWDEYYARSLAHQCDPTHRE